LLLLVGLAAPVFAQGDKRDSFFDPLLRRLRVVKALSNYDRGFGSPNDFYVLSKEFLAGRSVKDFRRMVNDRNPIIKAMGLLCLAQTDADQLHLTLALHAEDNEEVYLWQGCNVSRITVGEFARRLTSNPYFLDPEGRRPATWPPPNNGMHPTAVTTAFM